MTINNTIFWELSLYILQLLSICDTMYEQMGARNYFSIADPQSMLGHIGTTGWIKCRMINSSHSLMEYQQNLSRQIVVILLNDEERQT